MITFTSTAVSIYPSFIYSWSLSHILEHELLWCFGTQGSQGNQGSQATNFFNPISKVFFYNFTEKNPEISVLCSIYTIKKALNYQFLVQNRLRLSFLDVIVKRRVAWNNLPVHQVINWRRSVLCALSTLVTAMSSTLNFLVHTDEYCKDETSVCGYNVFKDKFTGMLQTLKI